MNVVQIKACRIVTSKCIFPFLAATQWYFFLFVNFFPFALFPVGVVWGATAFKLEGEKQHHTVKWITYFGFIKNWLFDIAIRVLSLDQPSRFMIHYTKLYKYGKRRRDFWRVFIFILFSLISFWGLCNKTLIPLAFVGCEIITANSESAISYPTRARGNLKNFGDHPSFLVIRAKPELEDAKRG